MKYLKKGLFIAVVSTLIFLTGCDDILESFYPEFAGDGQFAGNSISVRVQVPETIGEANVIARIEWADPFLAPPEGFSEFEIVEFAQYDPNRDQFNAFAEFFGLPEGTYRVFVFVDANGNYFDGVPYAEFTDPSGFAGYRPEPGDPGYVEGVQEQEFIIDMTVGGEANPRRLDAWIEFDDVQETSANRNIVLGESGSLDSGFTVSATTVAYRVAAERGDVNLQDVVWNLRDSSGSTIRSGSQFNETPANDIFFDVDYAGLAGQYFLYADSILTGGQVDGQLSNPVLLPVWVGASTNYSVTGSVSIVISNADQIEGVSLDGPTAGTYDARIVFYGTRTSEGGDDDLNRDSDVSAQTVPGYSEEAIAVQATLTADGTLNLTGAGTSIGGVSLTTGGNQWVQVIIDVNGDGINYGDQYINAPIVDQDPADADGYGVQLRGQGFKPLIPLN